MTKVRDLGFADGVFFDGHVSKLAGLEDLATFSTLDELGVFVARDDLHARVLAWFVGVVRGSIRRL